MEKSTRSIAIGAFLVYLPIVVFLAILGVIAEAVIWCIGYVWGMLHVVFNGGYYDE